MYNSLHVLQLYLTPKHNSGKENSSAKSKSKATDKPKTKKNKVV